jgi:hypothetical protein
MKLSQSMMRFGVVMMLVAASWVLPSQAGSAKIPELLNACGAPHADLGDGVYKAIVAIDGKSETVIVRTQVLGNDPNNEALTLIQFLSLPIQFPEGTKPSAAAMNKIVELGGNMTVGKVALWPGAVVYSSVIWYSTATADTFGSELILAVMSSGAIKEQIGPFFQGE